MRWPNKAKPAATTIAQHPSPQDKGAGGTTAFNVAATGEGTMTAWKQGTDMRIYLDDLAIKL